MLIIYWKNALKYVKNALSNAKDIRIWNIAGNVLKLAEPAQKPVHFLPRCNLPFCFSMELLVCWYEMNHIVFDKTHLIQAGAISSLPWCPCGIKPIVK